jgi:hypothetical protein
MSILTSWSSLSFLCTFLPQVLSHALCARAEEVKSFVCMQSYAFQVTRVDIVVRDPEFGLGLKLFFCLLCRIHTLMNIA